ncbi:AraC family transcriptional regulator [Dulcicalothrix desertica PCC 7102]|uniref:AraC family transcriptional regulator n=1 Tax=Dulcicalothrix desertica PCC 7102 TaxID=232991 RepID=A0A433VHQ5_9CYAN|nr:helix-turn-helix domain-containing protein [Dulcicalothrix desertica]RUT05605.1 AraC family transcriptional regulator [Dulcicalothrix desertica PCC 7102]TWH54701.1 AraC family transcriptional regulator [Dulcicalothrix desertica PCC 7102]
MNIALNSEITEIIYSSNEGLIVSSQDLGWESIIVKEYRLPPSQCSYPALAVHDFTLCLSARPQRIHQMMGRQRYVGIYRKGDICITPAGIEGTFRSEGGDHFVQVQIEPQLLKLATQEIAEIDASNLELIPQFHSRNSQMEQITMMLHSELIQGNGWGNKLYIESLRNALAVILLRNYCINRISTSFYEGGLCNRLLLVVTDYINDNLATEIKLSDLAELAGISQFHFSRLFKQSMGMSPYQYVMTERIERAKSLLNNSHLSITEIALTLGFNSHSHLGKHFRKVMGVTPKDYRSRYY